jgi:hypothetical protein
MDYHILIGCTGLRIFLYVISRLFKSGNFSIFAYSSFVSISDLLFQKIVLPTNATF